jgi:hypothetical protein
MSQHDLDIANQTASAARADINLSLKALGSTNSGSTAPATTYANMLWYDTSANILKIRSEADDAWISIGYLDQAADAFSVFDDTKLVNTSGTQVGLLGDQATATWQGGTGTLQSLVSPANVKAAILALAPAPAPPIGVSQSWASSPAVRDSVYQNVGGRPLQVSASLRVTSTSNQFGTFFGTASFQVSSNNSTWITLGSVTATGLGNVGNLAFTPIVPHAHYYRWTGDDDGGGTLAFATFAILS